MSSKWLAYILLASEYWFYCDGDLILFKFLTKFTSILVLKIEFWFSLALSPHSLYSRSSFLGPQPPL